MEIRGYTYGYGAKRGMYLSEEGKKSREALYALGINWVCLAFPVDQKQFSSTEILFDYRKNIPDLELLSVIREFHDHGVKVCLKPMINCADGMWRALINFPDEDMMGKDSYWSAWFSCYEAFLVHYAEIAAFLGCEMFCLGCEMLGTERKESFWRKAIEAVRRVYTGPLVYNTNHGKELLAKWYDAIDIVGTSAYFPVADHPGATREEMKAGWEKAAGYLAGVQEKLQKPILFMEIGIRSAAGCAAMPWDFVHRDFPHSEEEQAFFFDTAIETMQAYSWFSGFFWWDWSTRIYHTREEAAVDNGFNIHLKKAEQVVKDWYQKL